MQNVWEYIYAMEREVETIHNSIDKIAGKLSSLNSSLVNGQVSSSTPTTASDGAGSAQLTSGRMDVLLDRVLSVVDTMERDKEVLRFAASLLRQQIRLVFSWFNSLPSADGGSALPALPSDRPQDNWPSASCDPTHQPDHSARTSAKRRIDWSAVRDMVVARASGLEGLSGVSVWHTRQIAALVETVLSLEYPDLFTG